MAHKMDVIVSARLEIQRLSRELVESIEEPGRQSREANRIAAELDGVATYLKTPRERLKEAVEAALRLPEYAEATERFAVLDEVLAAANDVLAEG